MSDYNLQTLLYYRNKDFFFFLRNKLSFDREVEESLFHIILNLSAVADALCVLLRRHDDCGREGL